MTKQTTTGLGWTPGSDVNAEIATVLGNMTSGDELVFTDQYTHTGGNHDVPDGCKITGVPDANGQKTNGLLILDSMPDSMAVNGVPFSSKSVFRSGNDCEFRDFAILDDHDHYLENFRHDWPGSGYNREPLIKAASKSGAVVDGMDLIVGGALAHVQFSSCVEPRLTNSKLRDGKWMIYYLGANMNGQIGFNDVAGGVWQNQNQGDGMKTVKAGSSGPVGTKVFNNRWECSRDGIDTTAGFFKGAVFSNLFINCGIDFKNTFNDNHTLNDTILNKLFRVMENEFLDGQIVFTTLWDRSDPYDPQWSVELGYMLSNIYTSARPAATTAPAYHFKDARKLRFYNERVYDRQLCKSSVEHDGMSDVVMKDLDYAPGDSNISTLAGMHGVEIHFKRYVPGSTQFGFSNNEGAVNITGEMELLTPGENMVFYPQGDYGEIDINMTAINNSGDDSIDLVGAWDNSGGPGTSITFSGGTYEGWRRVGYFKAQNDDVIMMADCVVNNCQSVFSTSGNFTGTPAPFIEDGTLIDGVPHQN